MRRATLWTFLLVCGAMLAACHDVTSQISCDSMLSVEMLDVYLDFDNICKGDAHSVDATWKVDGACGDYVADVVIVDDSGETHVVASEVPNATSVSWRGESSSELPLTVRVTVRDRQNEAYDDVVVAIIMPMCVDPNGRRGRRVPEVIAP